MEYSMENNLVKCYKDKFGDFQKLLDGYGMTTLEIFNDAEKGQESWVNTGKFNNCNLLYTGLRSMVFRDPRADLSLLDIDVWDLKLFFVKLRKLTIQNKNDIYTLLRFCIDNSRALYHLAHHIYIHLIAPTTTVDHIMAIFYLMTHILINNRFAEKYIVAFGERLPFMLIYLHRIFLILCDFEDSKIYVIRIKHVLWTLEKRNIYSEGYIRKMCNIFSGIIDPEDNPRQCIWDSYMFENLQGKSDITVFEPIDYAKIQFNARYKLRTEVEEEEEEDQSLEKSILRKFLV